MVASRRVRGEGVASHITTCVVSGRVGGGGVVTSHITSRIVSRRVGGGGVVASGVTSEGAADQGHAAHVPVPLVDAEADRRVLLPSEARGHGVHLLHQARKPVHHHHLIPDVEKPARLRWPPRCQPQHDKRAPPPGPVPGAPSLPAPERQPDRAHAPPSALARRTPRAVGAVVALFVGWGGVGARVAVGGGPVRDGGSIARSGVAPALRRSVGWRRVGVRCGVGGEERPAARAVSVA